ncbi:MAG TPA: gliding motility-associated C-terminal domain-containing protein, partial [Catalimonadaceae bacterium]|nr:gliding motility-associated C-terminal domain-containing protein [Catalimonadaceae bacterium]
MKRTTLLLITLFSCLLTAKATHIVGGGFSYSRVSDDTYRFNLTLYFDYINGSVGAKDKFARCHLFRKSDNLYLDTLQLQLADSSQFLQFSNPRCGSKVNLKTQVLKYSTLIQMNPSFFTDPAGYYLIWERCCRNNIITNINIPEASGQTFYMEFPAIRQNNQLFNNNSPAFGNISSDYPCINTPFQMAFGAIDADGDSLLYSLTDPLKGNSTASNPANTPPISAPYDPVSWKNTFSATNPLKGQPGLQVNPKTGLLTCTATQTGL